MAHIRKHPKSPYWYLRHRDYDSGKWSEQTTGLRWDDPIQTRKAQRMAASASIKERAIGAPSATNPAFRAWVPEFIASHGARKSAGTWKRIQVNWQSIEKFLDSEGLMFPRQIKYGHAQRYLVWRKTHAVHGRKVCHNTALQELKFLSQLMNQAVRMELADANPMARLGIAQSAPKVKPELTDEQLRTLLTRSRTAPKWVERAIWISAYTGCRFSECVIESNRVDMQRNTLTMIDAKRNEADPRKFFTIPMPIEIRWIFEEMHENGETVTCRLTPDKSGRINRLFREWGVEASFHSLRVTFVTRCHRAGLSMAEAMRLVNHSSQLVHRVYSRLNVEDVRSARSKVQLPKIELGNS